MTADLFSPLSLRETKIPNRLMVSPMCQYSCEEGDGIATEWHRVHLGSRAVGGAGVVMTEATAVSPEGRITPEDLGIWSDEHREALAPIAEFIAEQGGVPAIQLAHAGRKASKTRPWEGSEPLSPAEGGWEVLAPNETAWPYDDEAPAQRAMTQADIEEFVADYREAAERALDAGFEVAEVHAAHGYLLHEFLSPVTNDRDDEYGGDFENRTRLVRQVTEAVREVWPDEKPVFVRISGTDWLPDRNSWTIEESVELADALAGVGADLIDVSSGGIHPDQQLPEEGSVGQLPLAERIREETASGIAVGAVGGITGAEQADSLIREGRADLAIVGRKHLRNPYFALHAARELGVDVEPPVQYDRAF
ncbi:NADH:flavin oxidoreductase/NADH oxidase [Halalkalicoccus sp. NIPERK01]|uniref:NADH:flavin oxidoreductase/NADH oxidase n=1 Tax=Halalkalicoccus sp. NIPERK01 TaxID=3053469 RepID=UPI00256F420F|nr:NADH:flavin oxidoreductase/NADH oxidase [Halalkalicoccus sp. NIPERK01]MDL5360789.1 NADH:flavin oxidoreductase/NADH oxidase [Halalkalicoccus sp. NIPERK01]